jgi:hypothetical protein
VYARWTIQQAGKVIVTFYENVGDTTPLVTPIQIDEGDRVPSASFPAATIIPHFTITSWKTADGTAFTDQTNVSVNTSVYVNVKTVINGTPTVVGETVVHDYPLMTGGGFGGHGQWAGTINADGTIVWTGGAFRYSYDVIEAIQGVFLDDYDWVQVDFVASGVDGDNHIVYKGNNDGDDDTHTGGVTANGAGSITFPLRRTGFALQKWGAASETTITITKITFSKGVRHTVTFSLGSLEGTPYAGDDDVPDPRTVTEGIALGELPALSWAPNRFGGWALGNDPVLSSTIVDSSFANGVITAQWKGPKTVAPLQLIFTDDAEADLDFTLGTGGANNTTVSSLKYVHASGADGKVIAFTDGTGYRVKEGSGGYDWEYAVMKINLGAETVGDNNVLGDYDKITFTLTAIRGDTNGKPVRLMAANTLSGQCGGANAPVVSTKTDSTNNFTGGEATITLDINKGTVATLTSSTIEVAIWFHVASTGNVGTELDENGDELGGPDWGTSGKPTTYEIKSVVFSQN